LPRRPLRRLSAGVHGRSQSIVEVQPEPSGQLEYAQQQCSRPIWTIQFEVLAFRRDGVEFGCRRLGMLLNTSNRLREGIASGRAAMLLIAALNAHCNAARSSSGPTPSETDAATLDASADATLDGQLPDGAPDDAFFPVNDVACHRDPYLPDRYEPPCEQPKASPSCAERWCTVQPGCLIMGAPWCEPGRARSANDPVQVTLTHPFRMGQFEVTQREWVAQGLPNRSGLMPDGTGDCIGDDCPASHMTWFEALAFTNRLSAKAGLPECYELLDCSGELGDGMNCNTVRFTNASIYDCRGYRLPTGAEWEYAARAGTKTSFYTGDFPPTSRSSCSGDDVLLPIAWYCANAGPLTHPAGQKRPNGWGLHDILGNAAEWVGSLGPRGDGYGVGPFRRLRIEFGRDRFSRYGAALSRSMARRHLERMAQPFVGRQGQPHVDQGLQGGGARTAAGSNRFVSKSVDKRCRVERLPCSASSSQARKAPARFGKIETHGARGEHCGNRRYDERSHAARAAERASRLATRSIRRRR